MKPKNVMLLGFVNKAVEYLDKHLGDENQDEKLTELKNIDLQSIKSELSENLDVSLGSMQSTMTTLLRAGNDAFDKFLEKHVDKNEIVADLDRIFDTYYAETKLSNQDELTKLLSFYNLDDDFDIDEDIELPEQPEIKEIDAEEDAYMQQIRENASKANEDAPRPELEVSSGNQEIDDILSEILAARKAKQEYDERKAAVQEEKVEVKQEPKVTEETEPVSTKQSYVSSLFEDLRKQMIAEDEVKRQKEMVNSDVYQRIHDAFPSLSAGFVRSVYDLKDTFTSEKPGENSIILLHRCVFRTVEELRSFVEIVLNHDYNINADERKLIVDTFKKVANVDSKIMTNIFEVANQANVLNGMYDGYRII